MRAIRRISEVEKIVRTVRERGVYGFDINPDALHRLTVVTTENNSLDDSRASDREMPYHGLVRAEHERHALAGTIDDNRSIPLFVVLAQAPAGSGA